MSYTFGNGNFNGVKKNGFVKTVQRLEMIVYNVNLNIGDYKWSVSNSDFKGWLKCDGRSVLKSDFPDLYKMIGNSFGSVDSGHFNIPNMNGRVLGQVGNTNNGSDSNHILGHSIGSENITLSSSQIPSHSHTGTTATNTTGITSSGTTATNTTGITSSGTTATNSTGITVNSVGSHTHTYNDAYFAENSGGGGSIYGTSSGTDTDNSFYWRTAAGGYSTTVSDINTGASGGHTHTISDPSHSHTFTASISDPSHSHTFTASITDPAHSHTFTTENTGEGFSHPNIQPTLFGGHLFIFAKFTY